MRIKIGAVIGIGVMSLGAVQLNAQASQALQEDGAPDAPPFDDSFAAFQILPGDDGVASGAVDITTITPPREIEQSPTIRTLGNGVASYYGRRFHGRLTANGERFNMNAMTAAHKTLPFGTKVRVTNPRNGKSVTVRINDRGPFIKGRTIDLSRGAAQRIGMIASGHARVKMELVE
ncbi:septal ring lytic transglycosylase RlpA family protein [Qipengyuania sp. DGS5-3]|uniref:septal ring lytic transglycosylase RlpA family protein n=1 Tax=Qipengyuania sp. DGS5-3 TaxID=3349632 RepID=UPI0036D2D7BA